MKRVKYMAPRTMLVMIAGLLSGAASLPGSASQAASRQQSPFVLHTIYVTPYTSQGGSQPNWQMISSPYGVSQSFSNLGVTAFALDPTSNSYVGTPTPPADQFRPGQGYWVYATNNINILGPGSSVDQTRPFAIPLKRGWNQVGNPFPSPVALSRVSLQPASGGSFSISGGVAAQQITPLYAFDPAVNNYVVLSDNTQVMPTWMGFWIYSIGNANLVVSPGPLAGRIFAATSQTPDPAPIYDITSGQPQLFASVTGQGWCGPLTISPDGHLWAATNAIGGSLFDITTGGNLLQATPLAQNLFGDQLSYTEGLAFDGQGNAYVSNADNAIPQPLAIISPNGSITRSSLNYQDVTSLLNVGGDLLISEGLTGRVIRRRLATGVESNQATGFIVGSGHLSAQLATTPTGRTVVLWQGSGASTPGIYDISSGGDFTGVEPLIPQPTDGFFAIDVNQLAVNAAGDIFVAGNAAGRIYVSRANGNGYSPFQVFAEGLGDTESVVVAH